MKRMIAGLVILVAALAVTSIGWGIAMKATRAAEAAIAGLQAKVQAEAEAKKDLNAKLTQAQQLMQYLERQLSESRRQLSESNREARLAADWVSHVERLEGTILDLQDNLRILSSRIVLIPLPVRPPAINP